MKIHLTAMRIPSARTVLIALFLAGATFGLVGTNATPAHALSLYSVNRTHSGLVAQDPLTSQLSQSQLAASSFWIFGGDAVALGAPYAFSEDSGGLHIGVQATATANFAGLYGLHRDTAMLAHAVVSAPSSTVPSGYPNVGIYLQTGAANVDYVYCGPVTASYGTYWQVDLATGNPNQAFQFQVLYYDSSANQALTRECTIMSNGNNYLAVYLDGAQVYQASNLNLGFQQPFQFFLETQTSYSGAMFTGSFRNFYLTSSDSITVNNMPPSSTAQIVSPSGQVLASSAASSGTATLKIGQFDMPLVAKIVVNGPLGLPLASTGSPVSIWGGDAYSLSLPGLGGGLVGVNPGSSSSPSVAVPTSTALSSTAGGAVQGIAAPSSSGVSQVGAASTAAQASTPTGSPTTVATAPLTALSIATALGRAAGRNQEVNNSPPRAGEGTKELSVGQEGHH
jgi:hypothetical protein